MLVQGRGQVLQPALRGLRELSRNGAGSGQEQ